MLGQHVVVHCQLIVNADIFIQEILLLHLQYKSLSIVVTFCEI